MTIVDFETAMKNAGLQMKQAIIPDGKLHRFHVGGDKPRTKNGWYILYNDETLAGAFGCWKRGISQKWCAKSTNHMSPTERQKLTQRMKEAKQARHAELKLRQNQAANKASNIWCSASPATNDHPYLLKKGISNYGLGLYREALIIPMKDTEGVLHSLQFISPDGDKRFLSGGRKAGCFFMIGKPANTLCIAEGYATAASIYTATGYMTAIAFDAGNLKPVALSLRGQHSNAKIIICADNDLHTIGNPGLVKAREAAAAIEALLAIPPCSGDFNDLMMGGKL